MINNMMIMWSEKIIEKDIATRYNQENQTGGNQSYAIAEI